MALPKYRDRAKSETVRHPRVAGESDAFIPSPVHGLWGHAENTFESSARASDPDFGENFADATFQLYPGWVRVGLPIFASIALWSAIAVIAHGVGFGRPDQATAKLPSTSSRIAPRADFPDRRAVLVTDL